MKLARASVHLIDLRLRTPFTTSFGTATLLRRPFVVLETDDGRRGVGEVPTLPEPAYKAEVDTPAGLTSLREWLLPAVAKAQRGAGRIDDVAALRQSYAWVKGAVFAKSGVEAAFWDLLAQEAGAPLWKLWGGEPRAFDVGVSIGGATTDDVLRLADRAVGLGYRRLKIKIWPGFDREPAAALRQRFPDLLLQVDANSAYDLSTWERLQALDDLGLLLIEQPLFDDDIVLHARVSRELATPLCLDESLHSLRDADTAISLWRDGAGLERLIVNIKPPRVSGFAEAVAIANHCREAGVRTWIGGMLDSAWGKAMNLQLNGLPTFDLPGDHFSPGGAYFEEDVTTTSLVAIEGRFSLDDAPGTGLAIDWARFERMGEEVLSFDLRR
ncbi:MAG: o-succinylbenzoate synthase [Chloroflexia bacterium]|nr:o-succinylbenzoate synthase [Chloroflexia bacterium]